MPSGRLRHGTIRAKRLGESNARPKATTRCRAFGEKTGEENQCGGETHRLKHCLPKAPGIMI